MIISQVSYRTNGPLVFLILSSNTRLSWFTVIKKQEKQIQEVLFTVLFLFAASTWSKIKPSSRGKEYGGLKWERVKVLVNYIRKTCP